MRFMRRTTTPRAVARRRSPTSRGAPDPGARTPCLTRRRARPSSATTRAASTFARSRAARRACVVHGHPPERRAQLEGRSATRSHSDKGLDEHRRRGAARQPTVEPASRASASGEPSPCRRGREPTVEGDQPGASPSRQSPFDAPRASGRTRPSVAQVVNVLSACRSARPVELRRARSTPTRLGGSGELLSNLDPRTSGAGRPRRGKVLATRVRALTAPTAPPAGRCRRCSSLVGLPERPGSQRFIACGNDEPAWDRRRRFATSRAARRATSRRTPRP